MMPRLPLPRPLRRFLKAEDGSETVQIVLVMPVLAGVLFLGLTSGIASVNAALLDRAVDRTARALRYDLQTDRSLAGLTTALCADLAGLPNCTTQLKVQLVPIARSASQIPVQTGCTDQSASFTPATSLVANNANSFLLLRACLPVSALAGTLPQTATTSGTTQTTTQATTQATTSATDSFVLSSETIIAVR